MSPNSLYKKRENQLMNCISSKALRGNREFLKRSNYSKTNYVSHLSMMYQICTLPAKFLRQLSLILICLRIRSNNCSSLKYAFPCILLFLSLHTFAIARPSYESSKTLSEPAWPKVSYSITYDSNTDAVSYGNFIESLRKAVTGQSSPTLYDAFRVLPNPKSVKESGRFVLVELTNVGGQSITLAIEVTDLYVVGYRTGDVSFFFKDYNINQAPYNDLFTNTNPRNKLPFGGGYDQLVSAVRRASNDPIADRDTIDLGIAELNFGIQSLSNIENTGSQDFRARPLLVMIQMVSEAARFGYIEQEVRNMIQASQSRPPSASSIELENNWGTLSEAIQLAIEGRFQTPVKLFGQTFYSINAEIKADVTVLKYFSKSANRLTAYGSPVDLWM